MSKSLGNSPDPLELIEKYSADGVRVGMLLSSPAGNDLLFDEGLCEQGRNFANKVWNAFRLVKGWEVEANKKANEGNLQAIAWFDSRLNEVIAELNDLYGKFRMSEALHTTYKLVWDDFCAWYLEMIKPPYVDGKSFPIDQETYEATLNFFDKLLKLMHPFMPFITEEIWHLIKDRNDDDFIMMAEWPAPKEFNVTVLGQFKSSEELITEIRNFRSSKNLSPKEPLQLFVNGEKELDKKIYLPIVIKLGNLSALEIVNEKVENAYGFIASNTEYFIPFTASIDMEAELARIQKEIEYNKGFLKSVMAKLGNEKFVANAKPEVVASETKKKDDAEAKIKALEEQLESLSK
jgi:valyl-tRNA synthetase